MIITIGSFDGFHKGHAELLRICRELSSDWAVISFWPHPSVFMKKLDCSLFTMRERELLRCALDIPKMYVLEFNERLRDLEPCDFWRLLRSRFSIDGLVMGSDFHFSRGRSGSAEGLSEMARKDGISKIIIASLKEKYIYSSSVARKKILDGDVSGAREVLGYHWFMMGTVIQGNHRGRTMNYPTANINISGRHIVPAWGVYSAAVLAGDEWHCGAVSIGNNPTFHDIDGTRAEVHILDFDRDIYGSEIIVCFLGRVRGIYTFADKEALMQQIGQDISSCRKIYGEVMRQEEAINFLGRIKYIYQTQEINPEIIKLL